MFYAYISLFSYMGANLVQMPAAAALRLLRLRLRLRLRLEIPAADRGTGYILIVIFRIYEMWISPFFPILLQLSVGFFSN